MEIRNVAGESVTITSGTIGIGTANPVIFISGTSFTYPSNTWPSLGSVAQEALADAQTGTTSITVDSYNGLANNYTHVGSTTIKQVAGKWNSSTDTSITSDSTDMDLTSIYATIPGSPDHETSDDVSGTLKVYITTDDGYQSPDTTVGSVKLNNVAPRFNSPTISWNSASIDYNKIPLTINGTSATKTAVQRNNNTNEETNSHHKITINIPTHSSLLDGTPHTYDYQYDTEQYTSNDICTISVKILLAKTK